MVHDDRCEGDLSCECGARAFLAHATPEETAAFNTARPDYGRPRPATPQRGYAYIRGND